jgi:superfamily II DNA or RNA helicase
MKQSRETVLHLMDYVNCKFENLDVATRRELVNAVKYFKPEARFSPQYKLGRWDGTISFASISGQSYINLLPKLIPIVEKNGYDIVDLIDDRITKEFEFEEIDKFFLSDTFWPTGHPLAGEPIILSDEQVYAVNNYLHNQQSIQSLPTGLGKTIITAVLSKIVEAYGRSIVIVPSKSLVTQTEKDYKMLGLDVGVFYGERKEIDHKHVITTWQSLSSVMRSKEKEIETEFLIEDIVYGVVAVITDEAHSSKATELQKILSGPCKQIQLRWGMTGTIPKEEYNKLYLTTVIGEVVGEIKAKVLQDKGSLAKCHINILQIADEVIYKTYPEERNHLMTEENRLNWIARYAEHVAKETGNVLLLIDTIETGKYLQKLIPGSVFVYGNTKTEDRSEAYADINKGDNKVLIASYGVAAVGININRLFNVFLVEPGKSFVRVIQSIGRGVRIAADKDYVDIWDVTSTAKFSSKHLTKRKEFYRDVEYPYSVCKIDVFKDHDYNRVFQTFKKTK